MTDPAPSPSHNQLACPYCPDGHRTRNREPWSAWLTEASDGFTPLRISVAPSRGGHVAEPDADWVRQALRDAHTRSRRATVTYWLTVTLLIILGFLAATLLTAIWIGINNAMVTR